MSLCASWRPATPAGTLPPPRRPGWRESRGRGSALAAGHGEEGPEGGRAGGSPGLRSNAEETPISAPSSPRPAVATAPEPAPPHRPLGRRQAAAPRPCLCPHLPASRTHAALPASPSLVLPASLTPLDADCLFLPSRGPHGDQCLPAPPPPVQCHAGTAPGGPAASSPQKSLAPARRAPGDAPRHCALVPLSCPRGSGGRGAGPGAAPAPSPEWVTVGEVAAGDPAE